MAYLDVLVVAGVEKLHQMGLDRFAPIYRALCPNLQPTLLRWMSVRCQLIHV